MTQIDNSQVTSLVEALTERLRIQGIPVEQEPTCLLSYLMGLLGGLANDKPDVADYLAKREAVVRKDIARIVDITAEFQ